MSDKNMEALSMPRTPYVAIKINPFTNETSKLLVDFVRVKTVTCAGCGSEFSIKHYQTLVHEDLASKQAKWLELRLADEHSNRKIHPDFVYLPTEGID